MQNENEHTYDNGFHPKDVKLKPNYKFYNYNIFFRILSWIVLMLTRFFLLFPKFFMGFKIVGKKNRKKVKGMIIISNHIHPIDAFFLVTSFHFKKIYVTMLQSNLGFGIVSKYMRIAAAVPIPTDRHLLRKFNEQTKKTLDLGKNILFYPEASLNPYCDHIRNFMPGAFHYAVANQTMVLPCCFTFHKPKGIYKLFRRKKPMIHFNILEPFSIHEKETRKETLECTMQEVHKIISDYFIAHSDYYYENGEKIVPLKK